MRQNKNKRIQGKRKWAIKTIHRKEKNNGDKESNDKESKKNITEESGSVWEAKEGENYHRKIRKIVRTKEAVRKNKMEAKKIR